MAVGPQLDAEEERRLAAGLFNRVWELLDQADRDAADDDELIHAAHASRYHWGRIGTPTHQARGEWQISRMYTVLGRSEPALYHAGRCLDLAERHGLSTFDQGAAHEALARSHRLAGDAEAADRHHARGMELAAAIDDAEDREVLLSDLATA